MSDVDQNLKSLVFRACLVAVWSDSSASSDERKHLSHLIETLADNEDERKALNELRLQDQNEGQVLAEAAQLGAQEKAYVLDTCLDTIASDKRLRLEELRFLRALRKTCGVGFWAYHKKLCAAQRKSRARLALDVLWRVRGIALAASIWLVCIPLVAYFVLHKSVITPEEECTGKDIVVAILDPQHAEAATLESGEAVFAQARKAIVRVVIFRNYEPFASGSGFVIGEDDLGTVYVVTNRHVVHGADRMKGRPWDWARIEVEQESGARFDATLDFYSREHDVALLAVEGMGPYAETIKLNLRSNLQVGQAVYAIGSPIGLKHTFTAGVVSALRDIYLQTDATIYSGSSGGPILDQHGALCGIATKSYEVKDYGFALYADTILDVLKERQQHTAKAAPED